MNIMTHFQGTPRRQQHDILRTLEREWNTHDVFVVSAPVACGKSRVADTLRRWQGNGAVITPNNLLVEQYVREFDDLPTLPRKGSFTCRDEPSRSCEKAHLRNRGYCRSCPYVASRNLLYDSPSYVLNYYSYLAHKQWRPTLVVDEAHNLLKMLGDNASIKIWRHEHRYPKSVHTVADIIEWMDTQSHILRLMKAKRALIKNRDRMFVQQTEEFWRGKLRPLLKLTPIDARGQPPWLWQPKHVKKIVLMSATINQHDIRDLGLDSRKVLYLDVTSPIPPANRPIFYIPTAKVSYKLLDEATPLLAERLKQLLREHQSKGVIHATYALAARLRPLLADEDRLIWHTRENKRERYEEFRQSATNSVLVASGMYEGIDLPHSLGRWQCITKLPYLSLGEPAIRYKQQHTSSWYEWETIKSIVQASGRICRTPTDVGVTYILDMNWDMLYGRSKDMFPQWFREALR